MILKRFFKNRATHLEIDENDPNLPECMRIRTKEELIEFLERGIKEEEKNPKTYTIEEVYEMLGIKK